MLVGWGDESGSVPACDPGAYLLAAALCEQERVEEVRAAMAAQRLGSEKKIHWRGDADKRHLRLIETVAALPLAGFVVVRVGPLDERPERRRRKCFEHFAATLHERGCRRLTLESRGPRDDDRDRELVRVMRHRRQLTGAMHVEHAPGPADPGLWVADAVCGAVVAARLGDSRFVDALGARLEVVEVRT